jgi:hypothetical protein
MNTNPTFRTILLTVFTTLIGLLVVGAWLITASAGLSQETAPDGPLSSLQPSSAASASGGDGEGEGDAQLLPASLGGDGSATGSLSAQAAQTESGPDMPEEPNLTFSYYRLIGTAFNPRTTATTYEYNFNGCIYETGGTDNRFMAPLLVPDGAVLKYLRFYYNDTSAGTNLTAYLTRYQPGVSSEDLTIISSAGSSGYGTALSDEITHTVDLATWAYTIIIAPNANASTNSFCGVRVAYYAPVFGAVALPVIMK